ncbi:MAG: hypothetical protein AAGC76_06915 [Luteibacter sp.]|uniref:hypothetical protein n=1 Tax=Luteibacter sp. TaxID=1886636 RepID=UPI00280A47C9|nr:hypothetical protein [Luteibacter sp.]MDQ7995567.1 hypothetical protein [Luteibacter sp.]MDQ8047655.1 hypothetical protein [Luteibacter sp.]
MPEAASGSTVCLHSGCIAVMDRAHRRCYCCLSRFGDIMDIAAHFMSPEPLGWLASLILLGTIGRQIWRQAHAPTVEGVSKWLFIGQMAASLLYLVYSVLVKNPVFIASNAALLIAGITGQIIYLKRKHRDEAARE